MITETSKLSGFHTDDGITLEVKIYLYDEEDGWTLNVIAPDGCDSVFGQGFDTEQEALEEFRKTVTEYGADYFLRPRLPSAPLHSRKPLIPLLRSLRPRRVRPLTARRNKRPPRRPTSRIRRGTRLQTAVPTRT